MLVPSGQSLMHPISTLTDWKYFNEESADFVANQLHDYDYSTEHGNIQRIEPHEYYFDPQPNCLFHSM